MRHEARASIQASRRQFPQGTFGILFSWLLGCCRLSMFTQKYVSSSLYALPCKTMRWMNVALWQWFYCWNLSSSLRIPAGNLNLWYFDFQFFFALVHTLSDTWSGDNVRQLCDAIKFLHSKWYYFEPYLYASLQLSMTVALCFMLCACSITNDELNLHIIENWSFK